MSVETVNGYVLLPHAADWSRLPSSGRHWLTQISGGTTGAEDRAAMMATPYRSLEWQVYTHDKVEQQRLEARVLAACKAGNACAPFFGRGLVIATSVTADSLVVTSSGVLDGIEVGDVLIYLGQQRDGGAYWETAEVAGISGTTITLTASVATTWPAGSLVFPLITGRFAAQQVTATNGEHSQWAFRIQEPPAEGALPSSSVSDTDPDEDSDGAASIEVANVVVGFVDETGGAASIEVANVIVGFVDTWP